MPERVGTPVAVGGGIGSATNANAVENEKERTHA
jgi:hypothetical protein